VHKRPKDERLQTAFVAQLPLAMRQGFVKVSLKLTMRTSGPTSMSLWLLMPSPYALSEVEIVLVMTTEVSVSIKSTLFPEAKARTLMSSPRQAVLGRKRAVGNDTYDVQMNVLGTPDTARLMLSLMRRLELKPPPR